MKYFRLYADEAGESHVEELDASFIPVEYAPPAPPLNVSAPIEAERFIFVQFPAGWDSELHPTPRRQLLVMLSGRLQGAASDGAVMELGSGDVVLMEDTTGKGHTAQALDGQPVHALMVHLE